MRNQSSSSLALRNSWRTARAACAIVALFSAFVGASPSRAEPPCSDEDFAAAIDRSGEAIRDTGAKSQQQIAERMVAFAESRGLPTGSGLQERVFEEIYDSRLTELDKKTSELLLKIDKLSRVEDGEQLDCTNISVIDAATQELVATIEAKSAHVLAKLETGTAQPQADATTAADTPSDPAPPFDEPQATPDAKPPEAIAETAKVDRTVKPAAPQPKAEPSPSDDKSGAAWRTDTEPNDAYIPPPLAALDDAAAPTQQLPPGGSGASTAESENGYSIDEIREATRGFFGTISTNLASVIEHAFQTSGRPTGYVLGTEGGGAFLAGLRYGKGQLYMRGEPTVRDVYWHGPSLGTDFGAAGSRTLFLIYHLQDHQALYRAFTGIDGSAYFVGGVGLTLLKGGDVIMAPIRSGLGFRLGANIGYLRFTARPTWNPF